MKTSHTIIIIFFSIIVLALLYIAYEYRIQINNGVPQTSNTINNAVSVQKNQVLADYLNSVVNFAHEGYLADNLSTQVDTSDIEGTMVSLMEIIDDENQAVSFISKYSSSTDQMVSNTSSLMSASEMDVISKQQQALNLLRQVSNGTVPTDIEYDLAQVKVAQNKRNDNVTLALQSFPFLTMDTSSLQGSSTATVGPLNPTNLLSEDQKTSVMTTLQMDFGSDLNSNKNDIFLLLAQEIDTLLTSPTYSDFHDAWLLKVSNIQS